MEHKNSPHLYDFDDIFYRSQEGKVYASILEQMERPLFEWVLRKTEGNQIRAAAILGLNRNTFRTKMKKLGIHPEAYK